MYVCGGYDTKGNLTTHSQNMMSAYTLCSQNSLNIYQISVFVDIFFFDRTFLPYILCIYSIHTHLVHLNMVSYKASVSY